MLEILKETLLKAPVVKFNNYHYVVFPITDGIPMIHPELMEEITDYIVSIANLDCDKIVTAEAMGIHLVHDRQKEEVWTGGRGGIRTEDRLSLEEDVH